MDVVPMTPPPSQSRPSGRRWTETVAAVKAIPRDSESEGWAYVGEYSPGVPSQIRAGNYPAFLPEDLDGWPSPETYMRANWQITTRVAHSEDGKRRVGVWMRWIG